MSEPPQIPDEPNVVLVRDARREFDLRCLVQWLSLFAVAGVGALVASWIGAFVGGILGMVTATLTCDQIPSLRQVCVRQTLTADKYRAVRRRFTVATTCTILLIVAGAVAFSRCGEVQRIWIISIGVSVATVTFFTGKLSWWYLEGWRCARCNATFPRLPAIARYPHVCRRCGFQIQRTSRHADCTNVGTSVTELMKD